MKNFQQTPKQKRKQLAQQRQCFATKPNVYFIQKSYYGYTPSKRKLGGVRVTSVYFWSFN